jgi:type IV pilus assembly protein PilW
MLSTNCISMCKPIASSRHISRNRNRGFTLVELMVAMIVSLAVVGVATSILVFSSQSFNSNDAASQVNDSARFGTYIARRLIEQAGYEDLSTTTGVHHRATDDPATLASLSVCAAADICGYDNLVPPPPATSSVLSGAAPITGTLTGANGYETDTLILRFQGQDNPAGTDADGSIINCAGFPQKSPLGTTDRSISILYITGDGTKEPELSCAYMGKLGNVSRTPLIRGVEAFQVLYGVDASAPDIVTKNKAQVPSRYVRANEMAAVGALIPNPNGERVDLLAWRNVRAIRIGMVIRGAPGTAPPTTGTVNLYPLGENAQNASDPGSVFVAPNDTRLRRVVNFTVYIRNNLELPS